MSEALVGFINSIKETTTKDIPFERVEAMLKAGALFDALGAPHEHFNEKWNPKESRFLVDGVNKIGKQFFPIVRFNRFQHKYYQYLTSMFTDDTNMSICIMKNIANMTKSKPQNTENKNSNTLESHQIDNKNQAMENKNSEKGQASQSSDYSFEEYILNNKNLFKENQVMEYMNWVNTSGCSFMGHNTRELFGHIKTYKTYLKRVEASERMMPHTNYGVCLPREADNEIISMANGSLMRFGLLATLPLEISIIDCMITNNNSINIECSILLWCISRMSILNTSKEQIKTFLIECIKYYVEQKKSIVSLILPNIEIPFEAIDNENKKYFELITAIYAGIDKKYTGNLKKFLESISINIDVPNIKLEFDSNGLNIIPKCGYVIYGLYCAIYTLLNFKTYTESITWIINKLGDTDTNGAIAAYVLGAYYGLEKLESEYKPLIDQQFNISQEDENKYYGNGFGPIAFKESLEIIKNNISWKK